MHHLKAEYIIFPLIIFGLYLAEIQLFENLVQKNLNFEKNHLQSHSNEVLSNAYY